MSAPMVRALLAGTKTQTRRALPAGRRGFGQDWMLPPDAWQAHALAMCRYGKPGDRLWVREAWSVMNRDRTTVILHGHHRAPEDGLDIVYRASEEHGHRGWRPSIHLPRWASRITLEVTEVRVQQLRDISEDDALAEGMTATEAEAGWSIFYEHGGQ